MTTKAETAAEQAYQAWHVTDWESQPDGINRADEHAGFMAGFAAGIAAERERCKFAATDSQLVGGYIGIQYTMGWNAACTEILKLINFTGDDV